jgi:hypothetical protein
LLAAIAEIDERRLWAEHACPSMFALCVERFHMSESTAVNRIWAARTVRRFPVILEMLGRGELHLSGIRKLAKHLSEENHRTLLDRAKHKTSHEIERLEAVNARGPAGPPASRPGPGDHREPRNRPSVLRRKFVACFGERSAPPARRADDGILIIFLAARRS